MSAQRPAVTTRCTPWARPAPARIPRADSRSSYPPGRAPAVDHEEHGGSGRVPAGLATRRMPRTSATVRRTRSGLFPGATTPTCGSSASPASAAAEVQAVHLRPARPPRGQCGHQGLHRGRLPRARAADDRHVAGGSRQVGEQRVPPMLVHPVHHADRHPVGVLGQQHRQVRRPVRGASHTGCGAGPAPATASSTVSSSVGPHAGSGASRNR
jgi:hypothetical protein